MNTTTDLRQLRLDTLRTIAALAEQHDLPAPYSIAMYDHGCVTLRLDDDMRDGVAAWAAVLGVTMMPNSKPLTSGGKPFIVVKAERCDYDQPVWLGWSTVEVWSACDKQAAK